MSSKANDPNSYILKRIYYENKSSQDLRKIVSTVIGTCNFYFIFEILSFNKTFIQLDLAQGVFNPYLTRRPPTFFQIIRCITMKLCMKIASSFKKFRDIGPSHIVIIVMMSSLL